MKKEPSTSLYGNGHQHSFPMRHMVTYSDNCTLKKAGYQTFQKPLEIQFGISTGTCKAFLMLSC